MPCESCAQRREQMKQFVTQKLEWAAKWARVRNAKQAEDVQPEQADSPKAPAEGGEPADEAGAPYGEQGVEADPAAGVGEGRVSVPRVRKAGRGTGGAR